MTTLDDERGFIDPSSVSPARVAQRYGLIGSLVLIVIGLLSHLLGLTDPSQQGGAGNWLATVLNWGTMIAVIVLAIKAHRDEDLGGYMKMGRGFKTGFYTTAIMAVLITIWTFVFFSFISPETLDLIREVSYEQLESQGLTDDQIEESAGMMEMFTSVPVLTAFSFIGTLIMGAIFSVISAAILKREV